MKSMRQMIHPSLSGTTMLLFAFSLMAQEPESLILEDASPQDAVSREDMPMLDPVVVESTITPAQPPTVRLQRIPAVSMDAPSPAPAVAPALSPVRVAGDWFTLPYTINTLDRNTLDERQPRNLTEALERIPGAMVQKTANGHGSPYLRGFTGYRTLTVVDGVRYNNSIYRDGPSEYFSLIDVDSLESIDLVQGPGSVLYGSDAIGGTLALATKSARFRDEAAGASFHHGSMSYRGQTAENSNGTRFDYNTGVGEAWGLHFGASLRNYGNVDAADLGEQAFTGYDEWAYDARFDAALGDSWTVTAAHQMLSQDDVWRTHTTRYGVSFAGSDIGSDLRNLKDQQRSLTYLKLRGEDLDGFVDTATFTTSFQNWQEGGERIRDSGKGIEESFDSRMWGIDVQLESDTAAGWLTYGFDYYLDRVKTARTDFNANGTIDRRRIQGPVGDDADFEQFGLFLQDTIALGEKTDLILGVRFNSVGADIGRYEDPVSGNAASFSDDWQSTVGSVRLSRDLDADEEWKIFAGVSQSFRAPNLADLTRFGASRSDEIESAAVGLEPETFLTYEVGLKADTERLDGFITLYRTEIQDFITSTPTGRIVDGLREVTKQNSSEGFVQGVEASAAYELGGGFSVFGQFAWVEGEADAFLVSGSPVSSREPLSRIQPLMGGGGLRWERDDDRLWFELSVLSATSATQLNANDRSDTQRIPPGGTPGYTVLDLLAGWRITDSSTLYGGLENLLDESYRVHGSGSNEPGLGARFGIRSEF